MQATCWSDAEIWAFTLKAARSITAELASVMVPYLDSSLSLEDFVLSSTVSCLFLRHCVDP